MAKKNTKKLMTSTPGTDLVPLWSISTWIYGSYPGSAMDAQNGVFNEGKWLNQVAQTINNYNAAQSNTTSKVTQIYAYAADLELPWIAPSYAGNGVPPEPRLDAPPIPYGDCNGSPCVYFYNEKTNTSECIIITNDSKFEPGTSCPITNDTPFPNDPYSINPGDPSNSWHLSDPTKPDCQYGFSFVSTIAGNAANTGASPPVIPTQSGNTTPVPSTLNTNVSALANLSIIIDGRIDNGYLQGLNEFISQEDAKNMADLIVDGGYSQIPLIANPNSGALPKNILPAVADQVFQIGVGVFGPNATSPKYTPTIHGLQLDLEPFDSSNPNQMAFYCEIGTKLAATGQYFSIFTYPKAMNQTTADLLNGTNISGNNPNAPSTSYNNGYMIVALYDLVDMKNGIPSACTSGDYTNVSSVCDTSAVAPPCSATGDATTVTYDPSVPHTASGYYNSVLLTVKQTIALSAQYGIKYKFGIPVSSSVHEFENWGQYVCQFNDYLEVKPVNGFCRMYNGLPLNPNSGGASQLQYVQQAVRAIKDGIAQMGTTFTNYSSLFRGIDFYSFGYRTIWSPQNPLVDYVTGNVFYGNTPVYVPANPDGFPMGSKVNAPFVYTTPAYPTYDTTDGNSVMAWLANQNLDFRPTS